jgi:hypothetical protein
MCGNQRPRTAALAALAIIGLLASGCNREEKANPVSRVANYVQGKLNRGPILRVEALDFTNGDLVAYVKATGGNEAKSLSAESLSRLFDRFVDEKILLEAARQRNLSLTSEEKKNYLAKLADESNPGDAAPGPQASAPGSMFDGLLVEKYTFQVIKDIRVDDAEVQAYYDEHKKDFLLPERVQVSQILVPTEERAVAVLRRIENAPEQEFRKAAREESSGPEAFKGGMMGVYRQGDLPYDMERVIFALDVGKISQLELYLRLFPATPEFQYLKDRPLRGILVYAIDDPTVRAMASERGMTVDIFRPAWVDSYILTLQRRAGRAPVQALPGGAA